MRDVILIAFLFCTAGFMAQVQTATIESKALYSKQEIKVKLPKNYNKYSNEKYPLIIVLNGEYLLNPVIGQTQYQSNFNIIPSAIVVGIYLESETFFDKYSSEEAGIILESENKFIEFFKKDLMPYLDKTYKINGYKIVVGDNKSTDLLNSFLLQKKPIFKAYISLDPKFSARTTAKVVERVQRLNQDVFYYVARSSNTEQFLAQGAEEELKLVDNKNFKYHIDYYSEESHHSAVLKGMARGFEKVFYDYNTAQAKDDSVLGYENILDKD